MSEAQGEERLQTREDCQVEKRRKPNRFTHTKTREGMIKMREVTLFKRRLRQQLLEKEKDEETSQVGQRGFLYLASGPA